MTEPYQTSPVPGSLELTEFTPVVSEEFSTVGQTYRTTLDGVTLRSSEGGSYAADGTYMFPGTELIDPNYVFSGPGYLAPKPRRSILAVASTPIALVGIFFPWILPVAFVLAALGLRQTYNSKVAGFSAARAGLALSTMIATVWLLITILQNSSRF